MTLALLLVSVELKQAMLDFFVRTIFMKGLILI